MASYAGETEAQNVGGRLREWRKSQKLKGMGLCALINVSQGSVSDIENNKSYPSARTLISLILNTDINIYWLLTGEGKMTRKTFAPPDQLSPLPNIMAYPSFLRIILLFFKRYKSTEPSQRKKLLAIVESLIRF